MDRKKYTPQFKADAVELVITSKRPIAQCAVDLGINEGTLRPSSCASAASRRILAASDRYSRGIQAPMTSDSATARSP
ncbi:transposase [Leucobacter insecticola]|uniref:Transposase n=1 Tax=Leucobacter insecticola TaxID=2714934 RepID=A0A6G8FHZ2_9MICO|nr:transposase [Leucobacter insecticola]QIM15971.1 transposase [Leucobacter insecticola]